MSPVSGEPAGEPRHRACAHPLPPVGPPDHSGRAASDRLRRHGCRFDRVDDRRGVRLECVLDVAGDGVDGPGVFADGLEGAVFAPAGDVGDRVAGDIEPEGAEYAVGDAVDEDFAAFAAVVLVVNCDEARRRSP